MSGFLNDPLNLADPGSLIPVYRLVGWRSIQMDGDKRLSFYIMRK